MDYNIHRHEPHNVKASFKGSYECMVEKIPSFYGKHMHNIATLK